MYVRCFPLDPWCCSGASIVACVFDTATLCSPVSLCPCQWSVVQPNQGLLLGLWHGAANGLPFCMLVVGDLWFR